jgi:hypothetical protein
MAIKHEESFLDNILGASWGEWSCAFLVFDLLPEKGHGAVEMMKLDLTRAFHKTVPAPPVAEAVRAPHHQPVENGQKKRPLDIEGEKPLGKKPLEDLWNSQLFPQPIENESGTYRSGVGNNVASTGKDQEGLFRKSRQGANQGFDFPLGVHLIEPAKRCDNSLVYFGAFPVVFDDLKVFVLTGFFYSSEHAEVSSSGHFNITGLQSIISIENSKFCGTTFLTF